MRAPSQPSRETVVPDRDSGAVADSDRYHRRSSCRACGGFRLVRFLSLGPTALANSFLESPQEFPTEPVFPLDVYFCEDCSLVQLLDVIAPDVLFRHYIYLTGISETIADHYREYADEVTEVAGLEADDLVVEVASNDGSLLRCFDRLPVKTLGVEPATNIAERAQASGVETLNEFFDSGAAERIRAAHGPAKVVIGNNVLAHVDDPLDFLTGCASLLAPGGRVVVEVPYVRDLVERLEYDTIYHEHLCYFSVTTLLRLFERAGLCVSRVRHVSVHGGSLRVYGQSADEAGMHAADVLVLAEIEAALGFAELALYTAMATAVEANREALVTLLRDLRSDGKSLAAYGAPAKGNTLLNFCRIDPELIPYTVDRNPLKVGTLTPGMHIPVLPVSTLFERRPDYVLILAWNFADEIMRQQADYRAGGGKFILPIPNPTVV